jgi:hypothetical protein
MSKYFIALAMLLAVGAGCLPTFENPGAEPDGDDNSVDENPICKDVCGNDVCEEIVCQGSDCPCAETIDSCPQDCSDQASELIHVSSPADDDEIGNPVTIIGEARGNWYFEATFPIKIYDANNNLLGQSYATAQGEWMTTDFVPFTATIPYTASTTATGKIVLEKSNASGLPEKDDPITVPVTF